MNNHIDLIIFKISDNNYAFDIKNIRRIIEDADVTEIPNSNIYIDGIMNFEDDILKVLNMRKLVGVKSYVQQLESMFIDIRNLHKEWIDDLKDSLLNHSKFNKTTDPNKCELGIWLKKFNSYDEYISDILKELYENHNKLHKLGKDILQISDTQSEKALDIFNNELLEYYKNTISSIDKFISELPKVAQSLQKMIIYENTTSLFAIRIDSIEDIAHIDSNDINDFQNNKDVNEFFDISGVLEYNNKLINIVSNIYLPTGV
jgi:purine-binding chemotaxis protein CheW